jgi:hypothetical protein
MAKLINHFFAPLRELISFLLKNKSHAKAQRRKGNTGRFVERALKTLLSSALAAG